MRAHIAYHRIVGGNGQPGLVAVCNRLGSKTLPADHIGGVSFDEQVRSCLDLPIEERKRQLLAAGHKPAKIAITGSAFLRCPHVVAEVVPRARGNCERCGTLAPFRRKRDGSPYLEVHHRVPLAYGGDDTVENAMALCPNRHREKRFGAGGEASG